jgi:hypothetical protein
VPATTLRPDAPTTMPAAVAITTRWNIAFLECLTGLAEATSASDGHFKPPFPRRATVFPYGVEAFPCSTVAFTVSTFLGG